MQIKFDITENSTKRGLVWVTSGVIALLFLSFGSIEQAFSVMTIAGTVAGGLGVALKD